MFSPLILSLTRALMVRTPIFRPTARRMIPCHITRSRFENFSTKTDTLKQRVEPFPNSRKIENSLNRIAFLLKQPQRITPPPTQDTKIIKEFWTQQLNHDINLPLFKIEPLEIQHWNVLINVIERKPELLKEEISLPDQISEERITSLLHAIRRKIKILPAISFANSEKEARLGFGPEVCIKDGDLKQIEIFAEFILGDAAPHAYLQVQNIELTDENIIALSEVITRLQSQCVCNLYISPNSSMIR
jgi:hypothetical protein